MTNSNTDPSALVQQVYEKASQAVFGKCLITNIHRGLVAETIVALALEPKWRWVSADYSNWDFEREDGLRLEVKQSALLQSWHVNGKLSKASFDIAARTGRWEGANWIDEAGRAAHVYVFGHHIVADETADHRNPLQWDFYVVSAPKLPNQKKISLSRLKSICEAVSFGQLFERVDCVADATLHSKESAPSDITGSAP
jgi:hypothetical protein